MEKIEKILSNWGSRHAGTLLLTGIFYGVNRCLCIWYNSKKHHKWREFYEQVQEKANIDIYARMAYMDTMTGLGNRTAFLEENKSNAIFPGMISYIMMDANNLKTINDTLGHNKGDELIITIAKCMRKAVGHNGQCYRIGGDEFVIILKNKTAAETEEIINKVRCEIEFADKQSDITISVAIGYVWTDTEQKNLEDLMQHADDEMYKDKKKTKENKSKENTHSI